MIYADQKYDEYFNIPVSLRYMICGARRSGTTRLGNILWETGVMGKPFEYQLPEPWRLIVDRLPKGITYWDFLRTHRITSNGVFGFKEVAPLQYSWKNLVPDKVIYISRNDIIAQSISLYLAENSGAFFSFQETQKEVEYNYEKILNCVLNIVNVKKEWEEIFIKEEIIPLRIFYEDLCPNTAKQCADFLGIELPKIQLNIETPKLKKQATNRNIEWSERFRIEMEQNGCSF